MLFVGHILHCCFVFLSLHVFVCNLTTFFVCAFVLTACSSREGYMEKCVMNNYFGIGLDAKISLEFNNKREEHPEKCRWVSFPMNTAYLCGFFFIISFYLLCLYINKHMNFWTVLSWQRWSKSASFDNWSYLPVKYSHFFSLYVSFSIFRTSSNTITNCLELSVAVLSQF